MKIFKSETSSESQKMRKRVFRDLNALESILEPNWIKREFQPVRTKIFYIQCLTTVCSRDFNLTVLSVFDMLGLVSTQKILKPFPIFVAGSPDLDISGASDFVTNIRNVSTLRCHQQNLEVLSSRSL